MFVFSQANVGRRVAQAVVHVSCIAGQIVLEAFLGSQTFVEPYFSDKFKVKTVQRVAKICSKIAKSLQSSPSWRV
jgi:hypothetical protein